MLFLQDGHLKIDGTVEDIKKLASSSLVKVCFSGELDWDFSSFDFCKKFYCEEGKWTLETAAADSLVRELVTKNILFKNLTIERENLESAFLNLSQSNKGETNT